MKGTLREGKYAFDRSVHILVSSHFRPQKNIRIKMYRVLILHVALCECETWSLTLREERRPMVFENRVLRTVFGTERDEIIGGWRLLPDENLHNL
jgi:hypothetical protein